MLLSKTRSRGPGASASLLLGCLLFVTAQRCEAQNLVLNPSFEEIDSCPPYPYYFGFQESSKPMYWEPWFNSPDYFNACEGSNDSVAGVPVNLMGMQDAFDGNAHIGMLTYSNFGSTYREYVGTELEEPLIIGEAYYLSFRACAAEGRTSQPVYWACDNLGLLFTMEPNVWVDFWGPQFPPRNFAHLKADQVIGDTVNWTLVSGTFIADSAYQYVVVGNFFDDMHTDTLNRGLSQSNGAYSYVDAVCVSMSSDGCDLGSTIHESEGDRPVQVYPNPVSDWAELRAIGMPDAKWRVTDLIGRLMLQGKLEGYRAQLDVSDWPAGIYFVGIEGSKKAFACLEVVH